MALQFTRDEAARAQLIVLKVMMEELWTQVLGTWDDPIEEAGASERATQARLEELLSAVTGRDAAATQHLAAEIHSDMWRAITAELASQEDPASVALPSHDPAQRASSEADRPRRDEE